MPHYVYEIPAAVAPNRRIGEFPDYVAASDFAKAERQKQAFEDDAMISVIHAATTDLADASARRLHEQFDEARRGRQAPTARVAQFMLNYPEDAAAAESPGATLAIAPISERPSPPLVDPSS